MVARVPNKEIGGVVRVGVWVGVEKRRKAIQKRNVRIERIRKREV